MEISITVSDEVVREAEARGVAVVDFVETLLAKGLDAVSDRPVLNNALERIRALRSAAPVAKP